jgi:hypothetical protein
VYDAVGVRIKDLPITAEKVFAALRARSGKELETRRKESARRLRAGVSARG